MDNVQSFVPGTMSKADGGHSVRDILISGHFCRGEVGGWFFSVFSFYFLVFCNLIYIFLFFFFFFVYGSVTCSSLVCLDFKKKLLCTHIFA